MNSCGGEDLKFKCESYCGVIYPRRFGKLYDVAEEWTK